MFSAVTNDKGCLLLTLAVAFGCQTQPAATPSPEPQEVDEVEQPELSGAPEPGEAEQESDAAAATQPDEDEAEEPSIQEQLAIQAVRDHLGEADTAQSGGVELSVIENGPRQPWVFGIVNRGSEPVRLAADPRLLSLDVKVPGKTKALTCKLPDSLRPSRAERRHRVAIEPGEGVVKAFDPRLYCFASSGQHVLVPGAIVTPKFGWPEKVKTVWKRGHKETVKLEQSDPFVVRGLSRARTVEANSTDADADANADVDSDADTNSDEALEPQQLSVKELQASPLALGSEYQEWSSAAIQHQRKGRSPIVIDMKQGSDANSQLSATVAITLKNRDKSAHYVYFRRELLSFEVMGPGGMVSCDPEPDTRAPDRQAFLRLAPNQVMTITSRLVEMCPKGTFGRPGFYLVHARFEADEAGDEFGLDAYVGRVSSETPANVRIRSGELEQSDQETLRPLTIIQ